MAQAGVRRPTILQGETPATEVRPDINTTPSRRMNTETRRQLANDIWSICNLLRGPYKRKECRQALISSAVTGNIDVWELA